jgi:hypothetical protein
MDIDSNWGIDTLFNIIMTRRDLYATDRILWDFISGHFTHLEHKEKAIFDNWRFGQYLHNSFLDYRCTSRGVSPFLVKGRSQSANVSSASLGGSRRLTLISKPFKS